MRNRDIQVAWTYHNATKHSFSSIRTNPHFLDWSNRPLPFKIYSSLEPLPLPRKVRATHAPTLSAIAETGQREQAVPDLEALSHLLYFSAGVTRHRTYPGGQIHFRAAAHAALNRREDTLEVPPSRGGHRHRSIACDGWCEEGGSAAQDRIAHPSDQRSN
jgi:hypothetical protein